MADDAPADRDDAASEIWDPPCKVCKLVDDEPNVLCELCNGAYHLACIESFKHTLPRQPEDDEWFCRSCVKRGVPECIIDRVGRDSTSYYLVKWMSRPAWDVSWEDGATLDTPWCRKLIRAFVDAEPSRRHLAPMLPPCHPLVDRLRAAKAANDKNKTATQHPSTATIASTSRLLALLRPLCEGVDDSYALSNVARETGRLARLHAHPRSTELAPWNSAFDEAREPANVAIERAATALRSAAAAIDKHLGVGGPAALAPAPAAGTPSSRKRSDGATEPAATVRKCAEGHPLVAAPNGEALECDDCGRAIAPSQARMGCAPCDFDLCVDCGAGSCPSAKRARGPAASPAAASPAAGLTPADASPSAASPAATASPATVSAAPVGSLSVSEARAEVSALLGTCAELDAGHMLGPAAVAAARLLVPASHPKWAGLAARSRTEQEAAAAAAMEAVQELSESCARQLGGLRDTLRELFGPMPASALALSAAAAPPVPNTYHAFLLFLSEKKAAAKVAAAAPRDAAAAAAAAAIAAGHNGAGAPLPSAATIAREAKEMEGTAAREFRLLSASAKAEYRSVH